MQKISKLDFETRSLFNELAAAEQSIKRYSKTSEDYKYYKSIIKECKTTIKVIMPQMTWEDHYEVGKWLVNKYLLIARNIIKAEATTNSQRIKQLNKYFELSEIARVDSYRNYFHTIVLDF